MAHHVYLAHHSLVGTDTVTCDGNLVSLLGIEENKDLKHTHNSPHCPASLLYAVPTHESKGPQLWSQTNLHGHLFLECPAPVVLRKIRSSPATYVETVWRIEMRPLTKPLPAA